VLALAELRSLGRVALPASVGSNDPRFRRILRRRVLCAMTRAAADTALRVLARLPVGDSAGRAVLVAIDAGLLSRDRRREQEHDEQHWCGPCFHYRLPWIISGESVALAVVFGNSTASLKTPVVGMTVDAEESSGQHRCRDAGSATLLQFLLMLVAGWMQRQQVATIDYLKAENRMLRDTSRWRAHEFRRHHESTHQ